MNDEHRLGGQGTEELGNKLEMSLRSRLDGAMQIFPTKEPWAWREVRGGIGPDSRNLGLGMWRVGSARI